MLIIVNNLPANAGDIKDMGSIPGSGRFLGEGNGYLLQYSCLENSKHRGAWWATVHGDHEKSDTTKRLAFPSKEQVSFYFMFPVILESKKTKSVTASIFFLF